MDYVAGVGAAKRPRIHITAVGCARTVAFFNASGRGRGNREADELGARDRDARAGWHIYAETQHDTNPGGDAQANRETDARVNAIANTSPNSDTNAGSNAASNADAGSRAANVQPCVRDRDGERGVDQPDR